MSDTVLLATPPSELRTVTCWGLVGHAKTPLYLPRPSFLRVPITSFVALTNAVRVAVGEVLVAWMVSCRLAARYWAELMATVSETAAGWTVSAADFVTPPKVPEMPTLLLVPTGVVVTVKLPLVDPSGTVTLAGTPATDAWARRPAQ